MNSFQAITRKEIGGLQDRMVYIEDLVERIAKSVENSIKIPKSIDNASLRQSKTEEVTTKPKIEPPRHASPPREETAWVKVLEYISVRISISII
jgi:hypothetical protein